MNLNITETVETQQIGKVLLIGLNRPEKRNAVDPNTAEQLVEAFTQFENDPESFVAVLYGKGLLNIITKTCACNIQIHLLKTVKVENV